MLPLCVWWMICSGQLFCFLFFFSLFKHPQKNSYNRENLVLPAEERGACQGKHTGTGLSGLSYIVLNRLRFSFHFSFPASTFTPAKQHLCKGPEQADEWLDHSVMNLSSTWTWIWPIGGKVDFFPKSLQNDPSTKSKELLLAQMTPKIRTCCPSTVTSLIMITDHLLKYLPLLNNYNLMLLWTVSRESSLTCESWAENSAGAYLDQVIACTLPLHLTL